MKRSTFLGITLALIAVEIAYTTASLNETYQFMNGVLQNKYYALFSISYIGFVLFSGWFFTFSVPTLEYKRQVHGYFEEVFGQEKYSFLYTYHFLAFAVATFYLSAWPYFIMSTVMWLFWTWVRAKQNDYAEEYELERKKEEAKHKPTVVLDRTDLL